MQTVSLQSHVGADGVLHLDVPVMVRERNVEVLVVVQPLESNGHVGKSEEVDAKGWPVGLLDAVVGGWKGDEVDGKGWPIGFFDRTFGCLADDPIQRWPEGEFEIREELE